MLISSNRWFLKQEMLSRQNRNIVINRLFPERYVLRLSRNSISVVTGSKYKAIKDEQLQIIEIEKGYEQKMFRE